MEITNIMPITIHCPHDKAELQLKKENKGPEGLLECPKCGCIFRVCLAKFDGKCYVKMFPTAKIPEKDLKVATKSFKKKSEWIGGPMQELPEESKKKKRGRPKKSQIINAPSGADIIETPNVLGM